MRLQNPNVAPQGVKRVSKSSRLVVKLAIAGLAVPTVGGFLGCATTVEPLPPLPEVSQYTQVRHPAGTDVMDLRGVFLSAEAMAPEARNSCDGDYQKLKSLTAVPGEVEAGVAELVNQDPTHYHWCFYAKLLDLYDSLKPVSSIKDRQTRVLETFLFLSPVARTFQTKFNDSRYLRMAIYHYRFFSQWVFSRNLEITPEMSNTLVTKDIKKPFEFYRPPEDMSGSVLEKYGLKKPEAPTASPASPVPPVVENAPGPEGNPSLISRMPAGGQGY